MSVFFLGAFAAVVIVGLLILNQEKKGLPSIEQIKGMFPGKKND